MLAARSAVPALDSALDELSVVGPPLLRRRMSKEFLLLARGRERGRRWPQREGRERGGWEGKEGGRKEMVVGGRGRGAPHKLSELRECE